jgi:hypothetical protein
VLERKLKWEKPSEKTNIQKTRYFEIQKMETAADSSSRSLQLENEM